MSFKAGITLTMCQINDNDFNIVEKTPDIDNVLICQLTGTDRPAALDLLTIIANREHGDEYSGYGYGAVDPGKNLNPISLPLIPQEQNHDDSQGGWFHHKKH
jgi:hypothetical protein